VESKLYQIDIETGNNKLLPEIKEVWCLVWSPNGRQLTSLNGPSFRMYTQSTLRINDYDLEQGKVSSFVNSANFSWGLRSVEIPLQGWTAKLHLTMSELEPCAIPPGGL